MQLKSICFTLFILIGGTMTLVPIHADDYDEDDYEMDSHDSTRNRFPRFSKKQAKQVSNMVLGALLVTYFVFARKKSSILELEYGNMMNYTDMNYRVPKNVPRVKIKTNSKIAQFADKRVFFTRYDASAENFFTNLGCKPHEAMICNAANKELHFHKAGLNAALSDQIDVLLKKLNKDLTPSDNSPKHWGEMVDREGKPWPEGQALKIAQEYAVSKHPTTGLTITHLAGPDFSRGEDRYYPYLKGTIKQMLEDHIGKYKVICLCAFSAAIFSRNSDDRRVALKAVVEALEEVLKPYEKPEDLKTIIVCNYFDLVFRKHKASGDLDTSGWFKGYISGKLPT